MFLAVSFLLLGVGMVSSSPVHQQSEERMDSFRIRKEPRCKEITDLNDKWPKRKNNMCYNCECIGRGALCKKINVDCPLTLSCPDPVIPPVEECKCPHCSTGPTKPITFTITPTKEYYFR